MLYIKAGRSEFLRSELGALTLDEALKKFEKHPKSDVETAYKEVNKGVKKVVKPKTTRSTKKKVEDK